MRPSRHTSTAICRTTRCSYRAHGTAQRQHTAFGLAQDRKDLGFAISRHLHQNLLRYIAEKILLPHPLSFGEDYRKTKVVELKGGIKQLQNAA